MPQRAYRRQPHADLSQVVFLFLTYFYLFMLHTVDFLTLYVLTYIQGVFLNCSALKMPKLPDPKEILTLRTFFDGIYYVI